MSLGAMLESARELTLEAASSTARLIDGTPSDTGDIYKLLRSPSDRDRLSGLRAVHSLIAQGNDAREFFADIVKNVTSPDIDIRKLVYAYIVQYAEYEPDLALMAINGVQKFLTDQNPVARALALKTMSAIHIPSIASIVSLSIRELLYDLSPIVRIACCQAIGKCYELDSTHGSDLLDMLVILAKDQRDPEVQGWALATLANSFSNRLDILHKLYRRVAANIARYSPWCQILVVRLLVFYCRRFMSSTDPDLQLLLQGCEPLLMSQNSAVVIETAGLYYYLGTREDFITYKVSTSLMRLTLTELVLENIKVLALARPESFLQFVPRFLLSPTDTPKSMVLKLRIIGGLTSESMLGFVLDELKFYAESIEDETILRAVMETLAHVAAKSPSSIGKINKWLLNVVVVNQSPLLVSEALVALRVLMQQHTEQDQRSSRAVTLNYLSSVLYNEDLPDSARSTILWLVGEYCNEQPALASEVLRKSVKDLPNQISEIRLQMIQLAAKVYSHYLSKKDQFDPRVPDFFKHIIYLGRYDSNYDNRDRARMFAALLQDEPSDLATLLLQTTKPSPSFSEENLKEEYLIGSASLIVGHPFTGYISLQDWGNGDPSLRQSSPEPVSRSVTPTSLSRNSSKKSSFVSTQPARTAHTGYAPKPPKRTPMSLAQFLGPEEEVSDSSEEDEDEEEEEDDEDDSEDDGDDEDSDDDSEEGAVDEDSDIERNGTSVQ